MPLSYQRYKEGVFTCGLELRIIETDARRWAKMSKDYAYTEVYPIVAILDVTKASYITAAARQILSRASDHHYIHAVAVAAEDFIVEQHMRLTAMLSASKNIEVFTSLNEAHQYAENHARLLRDIHGEMPDAF